MPACRCAGAQAVARQRKKKRDAARRSAALTAGAPATSPAVQADDPTANAAQRALAKLLLDQAAMAEQLGYSAAEMADAPSRCSPRPGGEKDPNLDSERPPRPPRLRRHSASPDPERSQGPAERRSPERQAEPSSRERRASPDRRPSEHQGKRREPGSRRDPSLADGAASGVEGAAMPRGGSFKSRSKEPGHEAEAKHAEKRRPSQVPDEGQNGGTLESTAEARHHRRSRSKGGHSSAAATTSAAATEAEARRHRRSRSKGGQPSTAATTSAATTEAPHRPRSRSPGRDASADGAQSPRGAEPPRSPRHELLLLGFELRTEDGLDIPMSLSVHSSSRINAVHADGMLSGVSGTSHAS